jgi:hypothetical protein
MTRRAQSEQWVVYHCRTEEVIHMTRPEVSVLEVEVEGSQLEFLEGKAKERGISKEELVKQYIEKAINAEREDIESKEKRISLQGITSGSKLTDADLEEVKKIWEV